MWRFGAVGDLVVKKFDGHTIEIDRSDPPGTYSSRWAMPDGYFRAVYKGTVHGDRIDGTVYWNGNVAHPGTWYATITDSPCTPISDCPLTLDQVHQLGVRAADAKLEKAAALCSQITMASDANAGTVADGNRDGATAAGQPEVCKSKQIRTAMRALVRQEMSDPNAALLSFFASAVTGVSTTQGEPKLVDTQSYNDSGRYTGNDPGSFVCRGLFLRVAADTKVEREDDLASQMTSDMMNDLLKQYPHFIEWYKVKPLQNGHYTLTIIPTTVQLSRPYSQEFTYP
jgi:hypothetical protein